MLKVNPKELGRLRKFRNALLKRMRDPFYLASIILIVIGVVILNYSYLEPKPFNDYVEDNVYHVNINNINNSSVFYASGFAVGGQFHSNISFINPNGTDFSYRLYYLTGYRNSYGIFVPVNQTVLNGKVNTTYYTSMIHTYGAPLVLSLVINTSAKNLNITVIEREWYVTRHSSILLFDEIGTPLVIGGVILAIGRLSYNTSTKIKERKFAKENSGSNKQIKN